MVASAFTAPHVSVFHTVDVTKTMRLVRGCGRTASSPTCGSRRCSSPRRRCCSRCGGTPRSTRVARRDAGDRLQALREPRHRGATPRGLVVPNIKDAHRLGLTTSRSGSPTSPRQRAPARPRPPTCPTAPSRSRTSASSGSTPGPRSSTPASRRSSRSARSASSRGCTRARSGSARSPSWPCRSTTGSSTARSAHACWPTSPRCCKTRARTGLGLRFTGRSAACGFGDGGGQVRRPGEHRPVPGGHVDVLDVGPQRQLGRQLSGGGQLLEHL